MAIFFSLPTSLSMFPALKRNHYNKSWGSHFQLHIKASSIVPRQNPSVFQAFAVAVKLWTLSELLASCMFRAGMSLKKMRTKRWSTKVHLGEQTGTTNLREKGSWRLFWRNCDNVFPFLVSRPCCLLTIAIKLCPNCSPNFATHHLRSTSPSPRLSNSSTKTNSHRPHAK